MSAAATAVAEKANGHRLTVCDSRDPENKTYHGFADADPWTESSGPPLHATPPSAGTHSSVPPSPRVRVAAGKKYHPLWIK